MTCVTLLFHTDDRHKVIMNQWRTYIIDIAHVVFISFAICHIICITDGILSDMRYIVVSTDRLQCLQHGQESRFHRKTTPHFRWFFWAGIKTIGAMMLPFGCNTSQPIPNILADTFFSKNGQVKFWPDNENVGSVLKKSDISLLQLVVNRNERC